MENLNNESFKDKIFDYENDQEWNFKGDKPCIIDFHAEWCSPCKMLSPILNELSKEYENKLNFYKIDVDSEQQLSTNFGIRSIPSILFVPVNGQPQMIQGSVPKSRLIEIINDVFNV